MEKLPFEVGNQIELFAITMSACVVPEDWHRETGIRIGSGKKRNCYHLEVTNVYKLPIRINRKKKKKRINRTGNKFQEKLPRK